LASTGGKRGGGMLVTEFGDALIDSYRELERDFSTMAVQRLNTICATVVRHSNSARKVSVRTKLE
jgi:molybdate transport repressor ModE-like protein